MTNGDLAHELNLLLLKTRMTFRQTTQRLLKQNNIDMSFEMLQVMHCLWKKQGVSQQTLAEKTAKDKACLTNLINNLEKKNWVVRRENTSDRRNKLIFLTPEGEEMANRIKSILRDMYDLTGEKMNARPMISCIKHLTRLNEIFENYE